MSAAVDLNELLGIDPDDKQDVACWRCGGTSPDLVEAPCLNRCCVVLRCPSCSADHGGWGPVGCRCHAGGPNPLSVRYLRRGNRRRK